MPTQGQIQAQAGQTAQVTLTKPPVVSVPAVVSSAGVTTLPVTVAGISVAIGQAQKTGMLKFLWGFLFLSKQIDLLECCSFCPCNLQQIIDVDLSAINLSNGQHLKIIFSNEAQTILRILLFI